MPRAARGVAVRDRRAYVASSAGLQIFDVADPRHPLLLGRAGIFGTEPWDVELGNGAAYVATGEDRISVVDVSSPAAPVQMADVIVGGRVRDLEIDGTRLVAAANDSLVVLDVSNALAPRRLDARVMPIDAFGSGCMGVGLDRQRGLAFACCWNGGVIVVSYTQDPGSRYEIPGIVAADAATHPLHLRAAIAGFYSPIITYPFWPVTEDRVTTGVSDDVHLIGDLVIFTASNPGWIYLATFPEGRLLHRVTLPATTSTTRITRENERLYVTTGHEPSVLAPPAAPIDGSALAMSTMRLALAGLALVVAAAACDRKDCVTSPTTTSTSTARSCAGRPTCAWASRRTSSRVARTEWPSCSPAATGTTSSARSISWATARWTTTATTCGRAPRRPTRSGARYFEWLGEAGAHGHVRRAGPPRPGQALGRRAAAARSATRGTSTSSRWTASPSGIAVEVSTAGLRKPVGEIYPDRAFLEMVVDAGNPIALSSDAHVPEQLGFAYDEALALLDATGVSRAVRVRPPRAPPGADRRDVSVTPASAGTRTGSSRGARSSSAASRSRTTAAWPGTPTPTSSPMR